MIKAKYSTILSFAFCLGLFSLMPFTAQASEQGQKEVKIRISSGTRIATATLNNSRASQDFIAMMPMTITLSDYGQIEKVSDLRRRLSTVGAPDGYTPQAGDIAYYAPWGNLAIFRQDFDYSKGLIKLGEIDSGMPLLDVSGNLRVIIEVIK